MGGKMNGVKEKIVLLYKTHEGKGYLDARKETKGIGGLPSNVLHDDCLVKGRGYESGLYPAWAREILVYPEKGGRFKKGEDVVDSQKDEKGRKWILPASYVPPEAIGVEKVGLFVDPKDVVEENGKIVVHPKPNSVVILYPFIQESDSSGRVDEETRIPLEVAPKLSEEERSLWRIDGVGVRPLVRYSDLRQTVGASYPPGNRDGHQLYQHSFQPLE